MPIAPLARRARSPTRRLVARGCGAVVVAVLAILASAFAAAADPVADELVAADGQGEFDAGVEPVAPVVADDWGTDDLGAIVPGLSCTDCPGTGCEPSSRPHGCEPSSRPHGCEPSSRGGGRYFVDYRDGFAIPRRRPSRCGSVIRTCFATTA